MDMDGEVEQQLAQLAHRMDCMGTEDEETLVRNFQQILAPQADLNADLCRFFLDMNNWNLQAALGSFYDYNAQQMALHSVVPCMQFVADVTIGEGESVRPGSRFVKTLRVRNPGPESWPIGCCLRHVEGELFADSDHAEVEALEAGKTTDINLKMTSPENEGIFQSRWQMSTAVGLPFGDTIWCIVVVDNNGLLDITQQLASTNCGGVSESARQYECGGGGGGGGSSMEQNSEEKPKGIFEQQNAAAAASTNSNGDDGKLISASRIPNIQHSMLSLQFPSPQPRSADGPRPIWNRNSPSRGFCFPPPSAESDDYHQHHAGSAALPGGSSAYADGLVSESRKADLLSSIPTPVPAAAAAADCDILSLASSASNANVSTDMDN